MLEGVQLVPVLVAGLAWFFVGAIWYSFLFGKTWARLVGIDWENPGGNMALIFGSTFVLEVLASAVLSHLVHATGFESLQGGLHVALAIGIGIVLPVIAINNLFQRKSLALIAIDAGYMITGLAVAGMIVGAWR